MRTLFWVSIFFLLVQTAGCGRVMEVYDSWKDEPQSADEVKRSGFKQEMEERRVKRAGKARAKEWAAYNDCLNRQAIGDPLPIYRECRQPQ